MTLYKMEAMSDLIKLFYHKNIISKTLSACMQHIQTSGTRNTTCAPPPPKKNNTLPKPPPLTWGPSAL